jgi:biotin-dependent carboxylase-like uncharacterized protein
MSQPYGKATILRCPPGTSIQDLGRAAGAAYGIPTSGAMDQLSLRWANKLLQNPDQSAALECVQPGLRLSFDQPTQLSLAGATVQIFINGSPVNQSSLIVIASGDVLEIGAFLTGARLYICIAGGFDMVSYLNSRSAESSISQLQLCSKGIALPYSPIQEVSNQYAKPKWSSEWYASPELEAYSGPDWELLDSVQQAAFVSETYHLSKNSNRMGIQLEEFFENQLPDLPTNPVFPGMLQLSPGGKLILLMRDAGVTGGYPRILFLTEEAQSKLSQKKAGDPIQFKLLD